MKINIYNDKRIKIKDIKRGEQRRRQTESGGTCMKTVYRSVINEKHDRKT